MKSGFDYSAIRFWAHSDDNLRQLKRNVSVVEFCGILRKIHPTCGVDLREPVLCRGNTSKVFLYMLFPDATHWNLLAFAVHDCDAEDTFS